MDNSSPSSPQSPSPGKDGPVVTVQAPGITSTQAAARPGPEVTPASQAPAALSDTHEQGLVRRFGPAYFGRKKSGKLEGLNEAYWAGRYAAENIVVYEPVEQAFYHYNPATGIYEPESESAIAAAISSRMLEVGRGLHLIDLQKRRTAATLRSIVSHLRGVAEKRGAFANRPPIVHLANGVLVFKDDEPHFESFSPKFYSRNASPIAFDPQAKCERFLSELVIPAVHPDDVILLQKLCGGFLLGRNFIQRILILDGEPGRGKSQFANVVQAIVGALNCTQLRTAYLGDRFETYRFLKKTMLVGIDVEPDFLSTKGAAVLKPLVGGDWFDAEQKGGTASFQFQGHLNVLITSNARLKVTLAGDLGAWERRLIIVRFEAAPPKVRIPDFADLLVRTEGAGILNWMIEGTRLLLRDLRENSGDLVITDRQRDIVRSLLAESDSLRLFLAKRVQKAPESEMTVAEAVEAYFKYCRAKSWTPFRAKETYQRLEHLMLELFGVSKSHSLVRDGESQRGFRGVYLKVD